MAYLAGAYRVNVRGTLQDGAESWYNTWSVLDTVGGQDPAILAVDFATFYAEIFDLEISSHTARVGATARNLLTGVQTELAIGSDVGNDLADPMPGQLAARVSLTGESGAHGGPFITGWSKNAGDENGLLSSANQAGLAEAVSNFWQALVDDGFSLVIDRPTDEVTEDVASARVGQRFDIIRKRANDIAESYATVTAP